MGMAETDRNYFVRRALEERRAAELASSEAAQQSHMQLAEHYEKAAQELEAAGDRE